MIWALNEQGERVTAQAKIEAVCPICKAGVRAKCGKIISPHWAHVSKEDCDSWSEPETQWHIDWKNKYPAEWQEVVMGCHKADVRTPHGVIEFQNSPISVEDVLAREAHYGDMVWVVNAEKYIKGFDLRKKDSYYTFRWKHAATTWFYPKCPVVLDFGDVGLFWMKKFDPIAPCGGWGVQVTELPSFTWRRSETSIDKYLRYGFSLTDIKSLGAEEIEQQIDIVDFEAEMEEP